MAAYEGELYALGAALAWSIGSLLFHQARVGAVALNFFKCSVAAVLLLATLAVLASRSGAALLHWDLAAWSTLALSAVIGIVVGDSLYLRSIQILGPRRALILSTVAPPTAVLLGWWFLGEQESLFRLVGITVTLLGVVWVVRERGAAAESAGLFPGTVLRGSIYGVLAAVCQSVGAVWSKQGLVELQAGTSNAALEASFIRLLVAAIVGFAVGAWGRRLRIWKAQIFDFRTLRLIVPGAISGAYFGIWFSLLAFEHTSVGVATTLTSTSPIFILPLVWLFLRQRVSLRAVLGALVAVAGILLLIGSDVVMLWLRG